MIFRRTAGFVPAAAIALALISCAGGWQSYEPAAEIASRNPGDVAILNNYISPDAGPEVPASFAPRLFNQNDNWGSAFFSEALTPSVSGLLGMQYGRSRALTVQGGNWIARRLTNAVPLDLTRYANLNLMLRADNYAPGSDSVTLSFQDGTVTNAGASYRGVLIDSFPFQTNRGWTLYRIPLSNFTVAAPYVSGGSTVSGPTNLARINLIQIAIWSTSNQAFIVERLWLE